MRPLRPLALITLVAAGLALGACGSGTVGSDEPKATPPLTVPRTPGDTAGRVLVNPSEQTAQSGTSTTETTSTTPSSTTTTTAPTSTVAPTQTTPQPSGGAPAPGGQTGGGGTQTTPAPSGGAQFEDFCNQNPGAC